MPPRQQPPEPPSLQQLQESVNNLAAAFTSFREQQDHRHESYLTSIQTLHSQISTPTPSNNRHSNSGSNNNQEPTIKPPKLRLSPFDGNNPLDWIFQADQFFTHYSIPNHQRLAHVAGYMQGDALGWYQWMFHNLLLSTWDAFIKALEVRFGPSAYDNHQQALFKLKQTTTVTDYQREFERLCNRVNGLSPTAIIDCFISGLKNHIQNELAIHQPTSISQAIGLAKLIESKTLASRPYQTNPSKFSKPPLLPTPFTPTLPKPPDPQQHIPIRRLNPTEMQQRKSQGLCFNCDERFHPGHRCKTKPFLLLLTDEEHLTLTDTTDPTSTPVETHDSPAFPTETESETAPDSIQLSLQAATGQPSPRTLRFTASIYGHNLTVLVDSGSSHNIIQPRIATFLHLPIHNFPSFPVMVGNGEYLHCSGLCMDTPLMIQNHLFTIPLYVLPIQGADLVLGVQWLQTLGPFISDFSVPSMQFHHQNTQLTITGTKPQLATPASIHQLNRMIHTHSVATFHSVTMIPLTQSTITHAQNDSTDRDNFILNCHPDIQQLLHQFSHIFDKPKTLPPTRPHDHHIHLNPNAQPINIKPY